MLALHEVAAIPLCTIPYIQGIFIYMKPLSALLAIALIAGCASTSSSLTGSESGAILPHQAVLLAAEAAPASVKGSFLMTVQATGVDRNLSYLNSELDYRDQRNLTIAISPEATQQLALRFGASPLVALKGKEIMVRGAATRARIDITNSGKATGKYYYQTHVYVGNADQITVQ